MKIAVFTGASSGMGREFVRRICADEHFDEVWLIARRLERLDSLAGELNGVKARLLSLDLMKKEALDEYKSLLEAEKVLRGVKKYYEGFHNVIIPDEIVKKAVILSERYVTDRYLPDKAIDLLDEACACASLANKAIDDLYVANKKVAEYSIKLEELENLNEDAPLTETTVMNNVTINVTKNTVTEDATTITFGGLVDGESFIIKKNVGNFFYSSVSEYRFMRLYALNNPNSPALLKSSNPSLICPKKMCVKPLL